MHSLPDSDACAFNVYTALDVCVFTCTFTYAFVFISTFMNTHSYNCTLNVITIIVFCDFYSHLEHSKQSFPVKSQKATRLEIRKVNCYLSGVELHEG